MVREAIRTQKFYLCLLAGCGWPKESTHGRVGAAYKTTVFTSLIRSEVFCHIQLNLGTCKKKTRLQGETVFWAKTSVTLCHTAINKHHFSAIINTQSRVVLLLLNGYMSLHANLRRGYEVCESCSAVTATQHEGRLTSSTNTDTQVWVTSQWSESEHRSWWFRNPPKENDNLSSIWIWKIKGLVMRNCNVTEKWMTPKLNQTNDEC